jgi:cyclophilin family peptidyl-prolyl cis-trans isomerase
MKGLAVLLSAVSCAFAQKELPPGLYAVFNTSVGTITAKLYEKETPATVQNFVGLALGTKAWVDPATHKMVKRPLYDNIIFHRILAGEIIQAGDPTGKGTHNCGFTIQDEYLPGLRFDHAGKLAMANTGAPDSGGCQFFITDGPETQWNGKYTIFGLVVEGQDVVSKISRAPARGDKPVDPVRLLSVTIDRHGPEPKGKKK